MFLPDIISTTCVVLDGGSVSVSGGTVLFDGGDSSICRAYPFFDGGTIGSLFSHDTILLSMQKTNINLAAIQSNLDSLKARITILEE